MWRTSGGDPGKASGESPWLMDAMLRIPLRYKILIANGLVTGLGIGFASMLASSWARASSEHSMFALVVGAGLAGVSISMAVNLLILWVALNPLHELERTAERIDAGDFAARTPPSRLADRDLERLARLTNQLLDRANAYRSRIRRLVARAVRSGEEERKRISWELHDDAAQRLATLLVRLRPIMNGLTDVATLRELEAFRAELADTVEAIRRYARGLRPPALDDLGVVHAIEGLVREVRDSDIDVRFLSPKGPLGLDRDAELILYRMVQEALTNVVKHACAARASVEMTVTGSTLCATISDDGRGFDARAELEAGAGLGLFGLRERAEYVGGAVTIESEVGRGTSVTIQIPMSDELVPCSAA